ncbi:low temperature requirement protein LtrA [Neorhizobium huautlense]|uniref:Low temperature requirement protein LtrA n=1 Tax=Neorhizobium huautlense TaxID=67774 RepID=A0ABT9PVI5_9HYPH|nr:low temperature requirement protein A [Neorhizobium huautlense]MDP9838478.1 low temperature requirement protein LtrA [Neorhizobium huautlense]
MADRKHHWLRKDDKDSTKASFPELFFDLVFVFALIQLSETLASDFSFGIAAEALLFIFALWWVWIHTTWVTNLLDAEIVPVRLLLFVLMFFGVVLAIALPKAFTDLGLVFAIAYSGMQLSRSLFALYAFSGTDDESYRTFQRITVWLVISCGFWIAGGLAEKEMRVTLWIAALAIEYIAPLIRYWLPGLGSAPQETLDINGEHLAERCALFVIIALGETILTTGKTASSHLDSTMTPLVLFCAFLSTVLMWWLYFHDGQERAADKAEEDAEPQATADYLFTYGHLPIVAGIILTAVGEDFSLAHPLEKGGYNHAIAVLGGPVLYLAGTLWMKTVSSRLMPWSHCAGIAVLLVGFLIVPFAANFLIQILASLTLLMVAVWEYLALRNLRRDAA